MAKKILFSITLLILIMCAAFSNIAVVAQDNETEALNITVVEDFEAIAKQIGQEFTHLSKMPVKFTSGSGEEIVQMIKKGEQFDVFISDSENYTVDLEKTGFTDGSPKVYAIGTLALYSKGKKLTNNGLDVLQPGGFTKIAVADPKVSSYGVASVETLKKLQIYSQVQSEIVYAGSVGEALQMVESGQADAGLVAYGDLSDELKEQVWIVPGRMHNPIDQSLVALKGGNSEASQKWITFMESDTVKNILISSGFGVTNVETVPE